MDETIEKRLLDLEKAVIRLHTLQETSEKASEDDKRLLRQISTHFYDSIAGMEGVAPLSIGNRRMLTEKKNDGFWSKLLGPVTEFFDATENNKRLWRSVAVLIVATVVLLMSYWLFIGGGMELLLARPPIEVDVNLPVPDTLTLPDTTGGPQ